jgi:hypothetical protein
MEKEKLIRIMKEKIKLGWDFEKTYQHLQFLDGNRKIFKQVSHSNKRIKQQ